MPERAPQAAGAVGLTMDDLSWRVLVVDASDTSRPGDLPSALASTQWQPTSAPRTLAATLAERGATPGAPGWPDLDQIDYWCRAEIPAESLAALAAGNARILLELPGLATLSEVWWNGESVCRSDNMFVGHRIDLTGRWAASNELVMRFAALGPELARRRPRPAWRTPMVSQQQLRWFRTSLLGRMPGWSPPTPVVGPWRDLTLTVQCGPTIERRHWDVTVGPEGQMRLGFAVTLHANAASPPTAVSLHLAPQSEPGNAGWCWNLSPGPDEQWTLDAAAVDLPLWHPHTHGVPELLDASLSLQFEGSASAQLLPLGAVGFRAVTLGDAGGRFALRVNGLPVFCRGACWMPASATDPHSERGVEPLLLRLRDAGVNMLRVPGNMPAPGQAFYDACDRLGILVWQELMFANMDYPEVDAAFQASVALEVDQLMSRLQGRPSVVVVCGNSEGSQQAAMWGAARPLQAPRLFTEALRAQVESALPTALYWPSSAWGGEGFPHQWNRGTTSYYGVGAYLRPIDDARRSDVSFATECLAFANVPDDATLARTPGGVGVRRHQPEWAARAPRDLGAGWDFDDVRDHYLQVVYGVDAVRLRYSDHARYLEMSRAVVGEVMTAAYSEWRRAGSTCGGALVWFLRDLWAGAGWGVLDDRARPKACFHALRRVWQPTTVVLTDEGGSGLYAHVNNDGPDALPLRLEVTAYRPDGAVAERAEAALEVGPHACEAVPLAALFDRFVDLNWAYRFGPALANVVLVSLRHAQTDRPYGRAFHFPLGQGVFAAGSPGLAATWRAVDADRVDVTVTTERFAQSVHFDIPGFLADDDYFHLEPGGRSVVRCEREPTARPQPFRGSVAALNAAVPVSITASA